MTLHQQLSWKKIKIRIKSKPLTIAFCDFICLTDSLPWFCGQFVLSIFLLSQLGSQNYCQINFHMRHKLHQPLPPALPLPPSPLRRCLHRRCGGGECHYLYHRCRRGERRHHCLPLPPQIRWEMSPSDAHTRIGNSQHICYRYWAPSV